MGNSSGVPSRWPSHSEVATIHQFQRRLVTHESAKHEPLLRRLWSLVASDGAAYEPTGKTWEDVGFQQPDPSSDIRGGGALCLDQLIYFLERYPTRAKSMIAEQQALGFERAYPWAAAGINITVLCCR